MNKEESRGNQSISGYEKSIYVPNEDEEISSLMDEAKTMWKVGSYHENIVNLQGISVNVEEGSIRRVSNLQKVNVIKILYSSGKMPLIKVKTHNHDYLGISHTGILRFGQSQNLPSRP